MRSPYLHIFVLGVLSLAASPLAAAVSQPTPSPTSGVSLSAAERIYVVMASVPMSDRKSLFRALLPAMKAEVWHVHFRKFAAENVLSPAQAAIVEAARNLFSEDLFSIQKSDPAWESQVREPLQRLEQSARNVFPPDLLIAAFGQLGPDDFEGTTAAANVASHSLRGGLTLAPLMVSECTCSEASDWCFSGSCGGAICYKPESDTGCGFGWRYECTSKCTRQD
jgi:hypothetical protein